MPNDVSYREIIQVHCYRLLPKLWAGILLIQVNQTLGESNVEYSKNYDLRVNSC